ncbi:MAG: M10 family metallopeptidase C-terminal domain-containing protein [Allosphingosinicella sp.]
MAILNGTSGNDVIIGTSDGDTIEGLAGADRLEGLVGDDILRGGDQNDRLLDGEGNDTLEGGGGDDIISDSYGNDSSNGGDGNDYIESIYSGNDVILGGAGNDEAIIDDIFGAHDVQVDMGADNDRLSLSDYQAGTYVVAMGTGNDHIRLTSMRGTAQISLGTGRDVIELPEYFDWPVGPGGSIVISDFAVGDAGDRLDLVDLMARRFTNWDYSLSPIATGHLRVLQNGANTLLQFDLDGGGDNFVTLLTLQNVSAAALTAENLAGFPADGTIPAARTIAGTAGADDLHGAAGPDTLQGLDGADILRGGAGNDLLEGGAGADRIEGQVGDDELRGGADADYLDGGYGIDHVYGEGGNDYLYSLRGADVLDGGADNDTLYINRGSLTEETVTAFGGAGDDLFNLYSYGASILILDGGDGADTISVDLLAGLAQVTLGQGADRLVFSTFTVDELANTGRLVVTDFDPAAGDVLDFTEFASLALRGWDGSENPFGAGYMRLVQNGADSWLQIDRNGEDTYWRTIVTFQNVAPTALTAASLSGFAPDGSPPPGLTITGTPGNDILKGAGGGDTIDGLGADDRIEGLGGDDLLRGGGGRDLLYGGPGDDRLEGGDGDDELDDGNGDDDVFGGEGNDSLNNYQGSDTAHMGGGNDHITLQRNISTGDSIAMFAEGGNDDISITLYNMSFATVDMGAGDDRVELGPVAGSLSLTLGIGADKVTLPDYAAFQGGGTVEFTDFNPAVDSLSMLHFLEAFLEGWDPATNPFQTGHARLLQNGADSFLQFDTNGGGDSYATRITLLGVAAPQLGASSLGYDALTILGGAGADTFTYTSLPALAGDWLDGAGGLDRLVLNGQFSGGVTFAPGTFRNIERIELLSAPAGSFNDYDITLADGNLTAASLLVVTAAALRAGESLAFRAEAVTGGRFDVTGGAGNDTVNVGSGADADLLRGNGGDDQLDGGAGNDILDGDADNDVLTASTGDDTVRGGAGNDRLIFSGAGNEGAEGGTGSDTLVLSYGDAAAITMTAPTADPNGGHAGSLSGTGRSLSYGSIEIFDVTTGSGYDVVWGGAGDDRFSLGGGNDIFNYTGGTDTVDGGAGVDGIAGAYGTNGSAIIWNLVTGIYNGTTNLYTGFEYFHSLTTGGGQDNITTANVNRADRITLGAGNDIVTLWSGFDVVNGGTAEAAATDSGFDTLILNYGEATNGVYSTGPIQTNAAGAFGQMSDGAVRSVTFAGIDRFLIATGSGNDNIATGGGNDEVRTAGGDDILDTGGGGDLLDGGTGADTMRGGGGNDLYFVDDVGDIVFENAGEGTDEVRTGLATYVLAANFDNLAATSDVNHDFRGNAGNNIIAGGAGNDLLRLYDGGNDTVLAGAGADNIFFIGTLTAADIVNGGAGVDALVLQGNYAGGLTLTANITQIENISILGGGNTNFGDPGTNLYDYVLTTNNANFAAGVQARINGAALLEGEDFTFNGSAEADASFVVYGGKGKDTLTGGFGNDIFIYAEDRFAPGDTVNGGPNGYDGIFFRGNYTIDFNAPGYFGLMTTIENMTLTSITDERYARGGDPAGFDYDITLADNQLLAGIEFTVSGTFLTANETMIVDGSQELDGRFRFFAGKSSDTLKGGAQNDLLFGNLGADQLTGGGGADTFRYDSTADSNSASMDQILDFTPGTDRMDLTRIDARTNLAGNQAFTWIGSNAFTGTAGQLRAFQQGGDWILQGDVDGDGVADLVIALTLQGPTPLSASDFVL